MRYVQAILLCFFLTPSLCRTEARATACLENYSDDFQDGIVDPVLHVAVACGSTQETGGKLRLDRTVECAVFAGPNVQLASGYEICGDFDVQVDYQVSGFVLPASGPSARYAGLQIHDGSQNLVIVERFQLRDYPCLPANDVYTSWDTDPNCGGTFVPTTDTAGKLRVTRTGGSYTTFAWIGGTWTAMRTGSITPCPVRLALFTGGDAGLTFTAYFDNLHLVADASSSDCPVPVEQISWGGIKAHYE